MTNASLIVETPMHTPPHPGRIVRQDCIEPLGLSIGEAAEALGVTRQTLDRLVNERGGISPEMALRLAKAFGSTPDLWLRLQATHDLAETRKRKAKELATIRRVERATEPALGTHSSLNEGTGNPIMETSVKTLRTKLQL